MITKVISGGQTGVDRAALDWALSVGLAVGGWCPKGRVAEDGPIPERYPLQETTSTNYLLRTKLNVRDAAATVIITAETRLTRGSLRTARFADELGRPWLHVTAQLAPLCSGDSIRHFCLSRGVDVLNVAGSRESKSPGIGRYAWDALQAAFPELAG